MADYAPLIRPTCYIVVGEQGEIDIAGRSLGRYQSAEKLAKKRELIGEVISFFDL
jgi:hypothetical protein